MQKIINDPKDFVDEMLHGILSAHPEQLKSTAGDLRCIVRSDKIKDGKVTISTGGGSGHPLDDLFVRGHLGHESPFSHRT